MFRAHCNKLCHFGVPSMVRRNNLASAKATQDWRNCANLAQGLFENYAHAVHRSSRLIYDQTVVLQADYFVFPIVALINVAAPLADEVFPDEPLRQRVISFPFPLHYLFAAHP